MSGNIVTVAQHALELQEISKEDATKVLKDESSRLASSRRALEISQDQPNTEWILNPTSQGAVGNGDGRSEDDAAIFGAHQTERDGNIVLPEQLPTATAAQNAIDAGTATIVDQLTFVFQLWHQARWDEAISLLDRTLAANEATESGQWIRRFLLLDARRMDALKSEVSAAIPKSLETPQPVSHDDVELVIARLFSLKTFARWTLSDVEFETVLVRLIRHVESIQAPYSESSVILQTLMQEQIDTLTKLRRRSDAMAVRQDMLQRWPDNMSRIHEMVNLLIQERKSTEGIALLESTLTMDRRWTLDEWNTAFESCLNWRRQRGEFDDGLALCERWIAQCPISPNSTPPWNSVSAASRHSLSPGRNTNSPASC